MDHIWTADIKSSEAMILAVNNVNNLTFHYHFNLISISCECFNIMHLPYVSFVYRSSNLWHSCWFNHSVMSTKFWLDSNKACIAAATGAFVCFQPDIVNCVLLQFSPQYGNKRVISTASYYYYYYYYYYYDVNFKIHCICHSLYHYVISPCSLHRHHC